MSKNIIFGCNDLALELYHGLRSTGESVTLFHHDQDRISSLRDKGVEVEDVRFDSDQELKKAGLGDDVSCLFALLEEDAANIFLCLSARSINKDVHIMAVANQPEVKARLIAAGANQVIEPYLFAADRLYQMLTRPLMVQTLDETLFGQQDLQLEEILLDANSKFLGQTIGDLVETLVNVVLVGGKFGNGDGDLTFGEIHQNMIISHGDVLFIVGSQRDLKQVKEMLLPV